jgi:hypothetical protein
MPIVLDTQQKIREVQALPFCYLCGQAFEEGKKSETNSDHVPPKRLFLEEHRDFPLVLKTHTKCNSGHSDDDQTIQQMVNTLHGKGTGKGQLKVRPIVLPNGHETLATNAPLPRIIRRWLQGFHAALYGEFLPEACWAMVCPPTPGGEGSEEGIKPHPMQTEVLKEVVESIKKNRKAKNVDAVITRKGNCRYECVWDRLTVGGAQRRACAFALDIYDWKRLGESTFFPERGCMGVYARSDYTAPNSATTATDIEIVGGMGGAALDPFAEG